MGADVGHYFCGNTGLATAGQFDAGGGIKQEADRPVSQNTGTTESSDVAEIFIE